MAGALVQTRVDEKVKRDAAKVLASVGMTVSDLMRVVLTRTAKEKAVPVELFGSDEAHDAWFRAKVREAIEDTRVPVSNDGAKQRMAAHAAKARGAR